MLLARARELAARVSAPRFQRAPRVVLEAPSVEGLIVPDARIGGRGRRRVRRSRLPARRCRGPARSSWARSTRCPSTRSRQPRTIPSSVCAISRSSSTVDAWQAASLATQLVDYERTTRFCGVCGTRARVGRQRPRTHVPELRRRRVPAHLAVRDRPRARRRAPRAARQARELARQPLLAARGLRRAGRVARAVRRTARCSRRSGSRSTACATRGSQSWPFPSQLMVGFTARYRSGEIVVDPEEIEDGALVRPRRPARAAAAALDRPPDPRAHYARHGASTGATPEPRLEHARSGSPHEPAGGARDRIGPSLALLGSLGATHGVSHQHPADRAKRLGRQVARRAVGDARRDELVLRRRASAPRAGCAPSLRRRDAVAGVAGDVAHVLGAVEAARERQVARRAIDRAAPRVRQLEVGELGEEAAEVARDDVDVRRSCSIARGDAPERLRSHPRRGRTRCARRASRACSGRAAAGRRAPRRPSSRSARCAPARARSARCSSRRARSSGAGRACARARRSWRARPRRPRPSRAASR